MMEIPKRYRNWWKSQKIAKFFANLNLTQILNRQLTHRPANLFDYTDNLENFIIIGRCISAAKCIR
jgi:hypothetical protein